MRIIAGKFKGHRLESPRGPTTRPTTDRVRESVFNLVLHRLPLNGAIVLDAFCGTGAFGLEAVSRGAARSVFVDSNRDALRIAARNASGLGVETQCTFMLRDAIRFLRKQPANKFDLIFADPPYSLKSIRELPPLAIDCLSENGLFVLEHNDDLDFEGTSWTTESRSYGGTIVTIFRASTASLENQEETT